MKNKVISCKPTGSQKKPCKYWNGEKCIDKKTFVDNVTGETQCRYLSSSVTKEEYNMNEIKKKEEDRKIMIKDNKPKYGLCFRCENRALFFETGFRPRFECGEINSGNYGCYAYKPIRPYIVTPLRGEKRPVFTSWMMSGRVCPVDVANGNYKLMKIKNKYLCYFVPKKEAKKKSNKIKVVS